MANWLNFERLKQWNALMFPLFQYDDISDDTITQALRDVRNVAQIPIHKDWEDDIWLAQHALIPEELKHAYRVAALVQALQRGDRLKRPISLDTFVLEHCGCAVNDGHHRIRALQYLGVAAGPFALGGHLDLLEEVVMLAGCDAPTEHAHYFEERLLHLYDDDVVLLPLC